MEQRASQIECQFCWNPQTTSFMFICRLSVIEGSYIRPEQLTTQQLKERAKKSHIQLQKQKLMEQANEAFMRGDIESGKALTAQYKSIPDMEPLTVTYMPRIDEQAHIQMLTALASEATYLWNKEQKAQFHKQVGDGWYSLREAVNSDWFREWATRLKE